MCLIPEFYEVKTSKKNITVYKILDNLDDGEFLSPFRGAIWKRGETKSVKNFADDIYLATRFRTRFPKYGNIKIGQGLHSYKKRITAEINRSRSRQVITQCTIPAGTPYIEGNRGDIVSLKLTLKKVFKERMIG